MSVIGTSLGTDRGIRESVRGTIGYLAADWATRDTSTPSVITIGDGILQDSIGYVLADQLPGVSSITFNRELVGTLLFLPNN